MISAIQNSRVDMALQSGERSYNRLIILVYGVQGSKKANSLVAKVCI